MVSERDAQWSVDGYTRDFEFAVEARIIIKLCSRDTDSGMVIVDYELR